MDDPGFDLARHVRPATSTDLDEVVATCMSEQLDRERPLWEIRIADRLVDGTIAVVGKAHHCMVDGVAAVELASLLLDPAPDAVAEPGEDWRPREEPGVAARLAAIAEGRAREQLELAQGASGLLLSPRRLLGLPAGPLKPRRVQSTARFARRRRWRRSTSRSPPRGAWRG